MSLPETPNAAFMAAAGAMPNADDETIDAILDAAWPSMYAAALRHAAEYRNDMGTGLDVMPAEFLRRLANEALS